MLTLGGLDQLAPGDHPEKEEQVILRTAMVTQ
jgi:hypothetical protein